MAGCAPIYAGRERLRASDHCGAADRASDGLVTPRRYGPEWGTCLPGVDSLQARDDVANHDMNTTAAAAYYAGQFVPATACWTSAANVVSVPWTGPSSRSCRSQPPELT